MRRVCSFRVFGLKAVPHSPPQVFMKATKAGGRYKSALKNKPLVEWQLYVAAFARDAMAGRPVELGPVEVSLEFSLRTDNPVLYGLVCSPEIMWNGEKEEWVKKGEGVPDTDNLSKAVLDAIQGVVYGNDVQVAILRASRRHGHEDAVLVRVYAVDHEGMTAA